MLSGIRKNEKLDPTVEKYCGEIIRVYGNVTRGGKYESGNTM